MTYCEWFSRYMALYKRDLKPKTKESYAFIHDSYIAPALGALELPSITPEDAQSVLLAAAAHGSRQAQITYALLRAVFRRALRSRLIEWSPIDALDRPTHHAAAGAAMSTADYEAAMPLILEDVGLSLAVLAGLRRGEICGLQWKDVDLSAGVLHIRRTRARANNQLIIQTPKSSAGLRDIPILPQLQQLLRSVYQLRPNAYVYDLAPESLNRRWNAIQREAMLTQHYRLHDLRHTFVTRLLLDGCNPRVVQYIAGHASIDMTMRIYTHVNAEAAQKEIASLMRHDKAI